MEKKKYIGIIGILIIAGILFFTVSESKLTGYAVLNDFKGEVAIYKSASCGCCTIYGSYFKSEGDSDAKIITTDELDSIKTKYGIPLELQSCHTTIIGDYFIEGHVPLEAVEKLLEEKPDIDGIALPGMPVGSPGMPGPKEGSFKIYAISNGAAYEFMIIS